MDNIIEINNNRYTEHYNYNNTELYYNNCLVAYTDDDGIIGLKDMILSDDLIKWVWSLGEKENNIEWI